MAPHIPSRGRATTWTVLLCLSACPGYELGHEDVLATDSVATDAPQADTTPRWDVLGGPCGLRDDGSYEGPCDLELEPNRRSTLCDEQARRCVPPEARCAGGWCTIPPRSFLSGAGPDGAIVETDDAAIAVVDHAFEIQETELTLAQFVDVMGYVPDGTSTCGDDCPVTASVFEAMELANRMSESRGVTPCYTLEGCASEVLWMPLHDRSFETWTCTRSTFLGPTCEGYRLPTTYEWELAARAGSPYCFEIGPLEAEIMCDVPEPWVNDVARYCGNSQIDYRPCVADTPFVEGELDACRGPGPVREKLPNPFGLYGVHGNVMEFTQRVGPWEIDDRERRTTPPFPISSTVDWSAEVLQNDSVYFAGAAWLSPGQTSCAWNRTHLVWTANMIALQAWGFRLVRTLPPLE